MSTADWGALKKSWEENCVPPCLTLEEQSLRAREALRAMELLRFSGWINSIRDLVDRQEEERREALRRWHVALVRERWGLTRPVETILDA